MALVRFTICTRNCLRKRIFTNYGIGSISNFTRSLSSPADAKYFETSEKNASRFTKSQKQSRNEIDDLNQMRSKMRALHGLTESSENFEIRVDREVDQSTEEAEFDYFEGGPNVIKQDANETMRWNEADFIEDVKTTEKRDNVEITLYGKIRRDRPAREEPEEDESDRWNVRKRSNEPRRQRNFSNDIDDTNYSFSKKNLYRDERQDRGNVKKDSFHSKTSSANFFDEQYFDLSDKGTNNNNLSTNEDPEFGNFIEEQFFSSKQSEDGSSFDGNFEKFVNSAMPDRSASRDASELPSNSLRKEKKLSKSDSDKKQSSVSEKKWSNDVSEKRWSHDDSEKFNFFDQKVLEKSDGNVFSKRESGRPRSNKSREHESKASSYEERFSLKSTGVDEIEDFSQMPPYTFDPNILEEEEPVVEDDNTTRIENLTVGELKSLRPRPPFDPERPETAYDAVLKLRRERGMLPNYKDDEDRPIKVHPGRWDGKRDSKGFRILSSQTKDMQQIIDMDLVSMLCDSVLFENEELLAINKPYGLPSQGGPGSTKSVASLLEKMAGKREKNVSTYHIVHRLDKETTGVMLLAKTERTAQRLTQMFLKRQVVKVYWAITKGVPEHPEGIIDIPIGEESLDGKFRMNISPEFTKDMRLVKRPIELRHTSKAVTHYKVLDQNDHCALVECRPESGLKHQIRCHLAFGLNTPILGDHKYSHFTKIAPQKLSPWILQNLGIRQPKVRHLAMHLHANSLVLPEFLPDGRNLFISAHIPPHFVQNMKWLKLRTQRW